MSAAARLLANQANAQLSTGPRTPEGKARSAQNATSHGLTGCHLVVRPDEREEFDALHAALLDELDPSGAIETTTFDELLHAAWNLRRFRRLESEMATPACPDPLAAPGTAAQLDRLDRYRSRTQRAYYRALNQLRTLQTNRALRLVKLDPARQDEVPAITDINNLTKQTQSEVKAAALDLAVKMIDYEANIYLNNYHSANPLPEAAVKPAPGRFDNPALRL